MAYEPPLVRGEWLTPAAGHHSFPPPRPRFPGPRQQCPHCNLVSETSSRRCPVCDARFRPTLRERLGLIRR
jgi:hypothetical protein